MIKMHDVYDWLDGRRFKVIALPLAMGSFYQLMEPNGAPGLYHGHEIIALGTLTKIQLGQIWSHQYMSTLVVEIVDFAADDQWLCREVDYVGQTPTKLGQDYILANYILTSPTTSEPTHGTQTCPRCLQGGALVLMQIVACMNKKCPCYTTKKVMVP